MNPLYLGARTTLTISAEGEVRLEPALLAHLGVRPGESLEALPVPGGRVAFRRSGVPQSFADIAGMLKREGQPCLTIDEINEVIEQGWAGEIADCD